ncbi:CdaR family transcriptional regulator [Arthrobacter sp. PM3]|uniref:PucR family transcriptional regulator n=1 Tax=Arthrobacter sp. PM3 TaxID=2017685 RepID=UPI000E1095C0|nr:helix-turn-helix domain-containing protein [Arthrobacter sp. PM3]AXJ10894.1 hypothetical protein CFN17_15700 [Arthrobacter sp. PM3]
MHKTEDEESPRWYELLDLLETRVDSLTEKFIARLWQMDDYRESGVGTEEIADTARETFHRLVHALKNRPGAVVGDDGGLSVQLGAKRARAGIPAEALITAVRLDFALLWAELLDIATPADAPMLTSKVEQVWRIVDEFAARTHTSYLDERVRMAQEESSLQHEFIARLFSVVTPSAETAAQVADALGLSASGQFGLAAASGQAASRLRAVHSATSARLGRRLFLRESGDMAYVFWPVPEHPEAGALLSVVPPALATVPCGVAMANGLRALPAAARTASSLAALLSPTDMGPLSADLAWPRLAKRQLQEAGLDLSEEIDEALQHCRGVERERLIEAVHHFLRSGNVSLTAEQLFCHRNTVLNRLSRFRELTGIDPAVPDQAARLVVAWA